MSRADFTAINHVLMHQVALEAVRHGVAELPYEIHDDGDLLVLRDEKDSSNRIANGCPTLTAVTADDASGNDADLTIVLDEEWGAGPAAASVRLRATEGIRTIPVTIRPKSVDVFDRVRGVFESDVLREKSVLVVGCGSGGSFVVRELVRSGIGRFSLVDHDRLEVGNVCRHELGLFDLARLKTNAMKDYIGDRNPDAKVSTHAFRVDGESLPRLLEIVQNEDPDVIVCGTDNRESRLLVNRVSVLTGKVAIYGGVRRRAYAGDVLRVIPRLTPCYQCFVHSLPEVAVDREVASANDAEQVAYTDRPVVPEPGLSTDIAPIALLIAKLVLTELTNDVTSSGFDSLREDLVAPLFFWLNRREADTAYSEWPPLFDRIDGPGILRWTGQWLPRNSDCPVCGDVVHTVSDEDLAAFQVGASKD